MGVDVSPDASAPVPKTNNFPLEAARMLTSADNKNDTISTSGYFPVGTRGWHAIRIWAKNANGTIIAQSGPVGFEVVGD